MPGRRAGRAVYRSAPANPNAGRADNGGMPQGVPPCRDSWPQESKPSSKITSGSGTVTAYVQLVLYAAPIAAISAAV
jgi:hypothetical protein